MLKLHLYSQDYPSNSDLYGGYRKDVPKVRVQWKTKNLNDINVYAYETLSPGNNHGRLVTEHLIAVSFYILEFTNLLILPYFFTFICGSCKFD